MEPIFSFKETDHTRTNGNHRGCFFCGTGEDLRIASLDGKIRTWVVGVERQHLGDDSNAHVLNRLVSYTQEEFSALSLSWHKGCYSCFTSEDRLGRLRKKTESATTSYVPSTLTTRSSTCAMNWAKCMFCQEETKAKLHQITSLQKSTQILNCAQSDKVMTDRLAGISDLIAVNGMYHLKCLVEFERKSVKEKISIKSQSLKDKEDACLKKLCEDLCLGLSNGNVYKMSDVWEKFENMCNEKEIDVPSRYKSRRSTFYDKVQMIVGQEASFVRTLSTGSLLMYPGEKSDYIISKTLSKRYQAGMSSDSESTQDSISMDIEGNNFQEMVNVALAVRKDLLDTPGHTKAWHNLDQDHVDQVIPNSLYLFLRLLFGGVEMVHGNVKEDADVKQAVCSIAQDIVYAVSNKRKLTPKHIGLGLALHQATRSESLLELFHAANHTIGIDTVRRIDTTMAEEILDKYTKNGNVYIPDNLVKERMIFCSCDNIDVLEATLDGKNTFHCTQMMVWQRGPAQKQNTKENKAEILRSRAIGSDALHKFQSIDKANLHLGQRCGPSFCGEEQYQPQWLTEECEERPKARAKDLAWMVSRIQSGNEEKCPVPSWGAFNETISTVNPPVTTPGMLPILQAPADDNDTLTTVINRFIDISRHIGQDHTIITADQPLYSRGKELVWANPRFEKVIFLLGGLHIAFNFLKVMGQHMENAGLADLWTESGVYAVNSTESMLEGKAYYRAVRGHLLTYEALWHTKWQVFVAWLLERGHGNEQPIKELTQEVCKVFQDSSTNRKSECSSRVQKLSAFFRDSNLERLLQEFDKDQNDDLNFRLWSSYMTMVETLMDFTRAQREGNWVLHIESFAAMIPWFLIYDHTNYARWGPIYLADMKLLEKTAPKIHSEFMAGNFVVKWSQKYFNQVSPDQATEWMIRTCKMHNGIIGITQNDQARNKFCITWSARSQVMQDMMSLYNLEADDEEAIFNRTDSLPSRMKRDIDDVQKIVTKLTEFSVFLNRPSLPEEGFEDDSNPEGKHLISLATRDKAPDDVVSDLLTAEERGKHELLSFVSQRLVKKTVGFYDTLKRYRSKTFADIYKAKISDGHNIKKTIKADRRLLQRLLNAATGGRSLEMSNVLQYELSPTPLSLATPDGAMNATTKSDLISVLTDGIEVPQQIPDDDKKTCVIIDGHALIQALGKPSRCHTFGDYANVFAAAVTQHFGPKTTRVDVVFDRYREESIKAGTRSRRVGKKRPVRKIIDTPHAPLPCVWANFIALGANKTDLARFLSKSLMAKGDTLPEQYELVTGGGFSNETEARSTRRTGIPLQANHEEADTRLILHSLEAAREGYERVLVHSRDTDVFLLLTHFLPEAVEVWMIAGTAKKRKCYPVHLVSQRLTPAVRDNILGFHAITGCDSTSSFTGHGKRSCLKTFMKYPQLVKGVGRDGELAEIEEFVCHLYGMPQQTSINHARLQLFSKGKKSLEFLPPTRDAFTLHAARANYQAKVWLQADKEVISISTPTDTSVWKNISGNLHPVWTTLPPIPKACLELVTCSCKTKCSTARCTCFKANFRCTYACGCCATDCCNPSC